MPEFTKRFSRGARLVLTAGCPLLGKETPKESDTTGKKKKRAGQMRGGGFNRDKAGKAAIFRPEMPFRVLELLYPAPICYPTAAVAITRRAFVITAH